MTIFLSPDTTSTGRSTASPDLTTSAYEPTVQPSAPVPFHRLGLLAQPRRWWRPLLVTGVTLALYLALSIACLLVAVVASLAVPALDPVIDRALAMATMNEPWPLGLGLLSIALLLPATLLAVRLVGRRPVGSLASVTGRLRWRHLGRSAAITLGLLTAVQLVFLALDPAPVFGTGGFHVTDPGRVVTSLALVVLLVPFQAAAEEVVFRGLLMQVIGSWLRHPAWAILLPLPLFVVGHSYSAAGLVDVAVFAALAGYLTWRTGGLEAAIGIHVVSNLGAFVVALTTGADLDATEIAASSAAISIAFTVVTAALVLLAHERSERRRSVRPEAR